jgi:hypothetical protein
LAGVAWPLHLHCPQAKMPRVRPAACLPLFSKSSKAENRRPLAFLALQQQLFIKIGSNGSIRFIFGVRVD